MSIFRKGNGRLEVSLDGPHRSITKYVWTMRSEEGPMLLFNLSNKPFVKETIVPVLELKDMKLNNFDYIKCEAIDAKGNRFSRELRI